MLNKIALKNLTSNKSRTASLIVSVTIGITFLLAFIGLTENLKSIISEQIGQKTTLTEIRVTASSSELGIIKIKELIGKTTLNDEKIEKIKQIPNVVKIHPQINYKNISSLVIEIFGEYIQTDALIFGLPAEVITPSLKNPEEWQFDHEPYPVVLSKRLLDLYNFTIAEGNGLPPLKEEDIIGKQFILNKDFSSFFPFFNEGKKEFKAKIVGFSDKANLLGVTLPYELVKQWNEKNSGEPMKDYMAVYVEVESPKDVPIVAQQIEELDLKTSYIQKDIKGLDVQFKLISFIILIIPIAILIVSGLSIFNTFMTSINERKKEIGILRTLGANRKSIYYLFFMEAGIIGLISGVISVILALLIELLLNQIFLPSFEFVSIKPDSLLMITPLLSAGVLLFSIIFCVVASYLPAKKAAHLDPVRSFK